MELAEEMQQNEDAYNASELSPVGTQISSGSWDLIQSSDAEWRVNVLEGWAELESRGGHVGEFIIGAITASNGCASS